MLHADQNNQNTSAPVVDTSENTQAATTSDYSAPVQQTNTEQVNTQQASPSNYQAPATTNNASQNYSSNVSGSEADAKAWIAAHESGGNYNATNGRLA